MISGVSSFDLVNLILNVFFGVAALYLTASLICFELTKCGNTASGSSNKIPRFLRSLCIIAAIFALIHHWGVFASFFSAKEYSTCYGFGVLWLVTYALGLLATYIFLWTRQHTINTNASLSYDNKRTVVILSWTALVILILGIVMVFLAGSRLIFFSNCSEQADLAKLRLYTIILSGILVTLTTVGQIQLLALFIIPLIKHHRQLQVTFRVSRSARRRGSSDKSNANMLMVKRCVVVAAVAVATDVIAAVITITVQHPAAKLVYDLNLLVNAFCCVVSFRSWRQMLLPCSRVAADQVVSSVTDPDAIATEVTSRM